MQPYFMPYISYFQLLKAVDVFVLYDDVNYINKGWINRNYYDQNGNRQLFTLPLLKASQNKKINEIELFEFDKFRRNFLKSLELSYKKSACYDQAMPLINSVLDYSNNDLTGFLCHSLKLVTGYLSLSIDTAIVPSSAIYNNAHLKAQERIIDICRQEKATHYINPIGGMELYSRAAFEKENIDLKFLKTGAISYKQFAAAYIPYLSVIDTLMHNTPAEINPLLLNYELINN